MIAAIRAEWLKFRSVRSNLIVVGAIVVLGIGLGALLCGVIPAHATGRNGRGSPIANASERLDIVLAGAGFAALLFGVLGVQIIGQEYRFSTIRATFSAVPNRLKVIAAKLVVLVAVTIAIAVVVVGAALLVGMAILKGRGYPVDLDAFDSWRRIYGTLLVILGYSVMGFGVGMIVRQPIGAIVLVTAWPLVIEQIFVGTLADTVGKWMPYHAASLITQAITKPEDLTPWGGMAYFAVVTLIVCALGATSVMRRDA